jgi:DNA-3-methyladenine glycosylase
MKLDAKFYQRPDVVAISRELLGKMLATFLDGELTTGIIVEVEAYHGRNDRACHAFNRRTARTEVMYRAGGLAYVYLCYGIHHLFNIVTNIEGQADAILVRALQPEKGINAMLERRNMSKIDKRITSGPGVLSQAMGIDGKLYGAPLWEDNIWIEDLGITVPDTDIVAVPRIGVDYAGEDALLPWRFYIKDNPWVSRK